MNQPEPGTIRSIYFIGIAGIGMSALARYFKAQGAAVAGYDRDRSDLAMQLEKEGIDIHYTIDTEAVPRWPDVAVYTPAIPADHEELQLLISENVPVMKRSEMLGLISRQMRCIAVAGTHGKTTTSSFLAYGLRKCGVDCTAFLGGISLDFASNFTRGESEWMVVEADEYDRSFLKLDPDIAVITAIDPDHLDVYGSGSQVEAGFMAFIRQIKPGGKLILHHPLESRIDDRTRSWLSDQRVLVRTYGESGKATIQMTGIEAHGAGTRFEVHAGGNNWRIMMPVAGRHNALNACAATAVALEMPVDAGCFTESFESMRGIRRRFEIVKSDNKRVVIDDYAHHPEELRAAIEAARMQFPGRSITGVFQPHLYSRTRDFFREFAAVLDGLDECVLVELYPAREKPIEGVSSKMIYDEMKLNNKHCVDKKELTILLKKLDPGILLFMGAGDLDRMIPGIIKELEE